MSYQAYIKLKIHDSLFLKDPERTELGQKILTASIDLLYTIGFEHITFRKIAKSIGSTEASVYRYFENKTQLLAYLLSWYLNWLEYRIDQNHNQSNTPLQQLTDAIRIITSQIEDDPQFGHISESKLMEIMIHEGNKVLFGRIKDQKKYFGVLLSFHSLLERFEQMTLAVNPNYRSPKNLSNMILLTANNLQFFRYNISPYTEFEIASTTEPKISDFLTLVVSKILQ
jgi:AcrR family transcriptional regulator